MVICTWKYKYIGWHVLVSRQCYLDWHANLGWHGNLDLYESLGRHCN